MFAQWKQKLQQHKYSAAVLGVAAVLLFGLALNSFYTDNGFQGTNKKIFLVTESKEISDHSYNEDCWRAVQHASQSAKTALYVNKDGGPLAPLVEKAASKKPGLLFIAKMGLVGKDLAEVAAKYPQTQFVVIDEKLPLETANYHGLNIKSQESSMLAGYLAGLMTKTGTVGFLGGTVGPVMDGFVNGYKSGVAYASKETGRPLRCLVRYANTYEYPEVGSKLAAKMYEEGCDIIFVAAGSTGIGALETAEKLKHYAIGVDVDQQSVAPHAVLASVLKNLEDPISMVVDEYLARGTVSSYELDIGMSTGSTDLTNNNPLVPYRIMRRVRVLKDRIISREMRVPATEISYQYYLQKLGVRVKE